MNSDPLSFQELKVCLVPCFWPPYQLVSLCPFRVKLWRTKGQFVMPIFHMCIKHIPSERFLFDYMSQGFSRDSRNPKI